MYAPCQRIARAPHPGGRIPASASALEAKLLKAYRAHLHQASQQTMEAVALYVYGPLVTRATKQRPAQPLPPKRAAKVLADRVELLDEVVLELVMLLGPAEQRRLAPLLLEHRNFGGFAKAVVQLNGAGNALYNREEKNPLDDAYLAKAAGLGKLSRADSRAGWVASQKARGLPTGGEPLVLTPWPPAKLRTKQKSRRRPPLVLRGQLTLWAAVAMGGGL